MARIGGEVSGARVTELKPLLLFVAGLGPRGTCPSLRASIGRGISNRLHFVHLAPPSNGNEKNAGNLQPHSTLNFLFVGFAIARDCCAAPASLTRRRVCGPAGGSQGAIEMSRPRPQLGRAQGEPRFALVMAAGAIAGSFIGRRLPGLAPNSVLLPLLAVILFLSAVKVRRHK